mmetsp:Transcript_7329/g.13568  ORF Transcript_7329/g.13568 Transcript_7329/m.13568 type:complete len:313 (+) Transcript_7329:170-1108(+)
MLMFENFMKWRQEFGTDEILSFSFPEVFEMKRFYPHGYHRTDLQGRPVYIERLGQLELSRLFEITTDQRMMRYFVREYERLLKIIFPACSKVKGSKVEQSFTILDLSGASMRLLSKSTFNFIKLASTTAQDYYPEILGRMFIVNAPMLFSGAWSTIKGFLDEKTRNKISIVGSKFAPQLLEHIDASCLPVFLGGTCDCPNGCLNTNPGPWNPENYPIDDTGALIVPKVEVEEVKRHIPQALVEAPESSSEEEQQVVEESEGPPPLPDLLEEDMEEIEEILQLKRTLKMKQENTLPDLFIRGDQGVSEHVSCT